MAINKRIYIDGIEVGYGTKATIKEEIESEETKTFSGPLIDTDPNPSVTVSIETLRAGTIQEYINMEKAIAKAKNTPCTIQMNVRDKGKDDSIVVKQFAYNCLLSSNEVEFDPTARTAIKLEFKGTSMKKYINGQLI